MAGLKPLNNAEGEAGAGDGEEITHKRKISKMVAVLYNSATGFLIKLPAELFQKSSSSLMLSQHSHDGENNPPAATLRSHRSKLNAGGDVSRGKGKGVVSNSNGKYMASAFKALFWGFNRGKDLDGGKRAGYVNSPPRQGELCRKEVVFERDGSISDAIAHCRLSFDRRNRT